MDLFGINPRHIALLLITAAVIAYLTFPYLPENNPISPEGNLVIFQGLSGTAYLEVEIAQTPEELSQGLMYRESLNASSGMLFIFQDESPRIFWMKNTLIPLDMIFISSDFRIVAIHENALPCPQAGECPRIRSGAPAKYVVEANSGFVQENGIEMGQEVLFYLNFE